MLGASLLSCSLSPILNVVDDRDDLKASISKASLLQPVSHPFVHNKSDRQVSSLDIWEMIIIMLLMGEVNDSRMSLTSDNLNCRILALGLRGMLNRYHNLITIAFAIQNE